MMRLDPVLFTYFLTLSILVFSFLNLFHLSGIATIPAWVFQGFGVATGIAFLWWPIDMIINWEKRTLASLEKDKYLLGIILGILAYVGCVYVFQVDWMTSIAIACGAGAVYPGGVLLRRWWSAKRVDIDPARIQLLAQHSPRYEEFMRYFPAAKKYVIGLNSAEGNRAHLLLHHRQPCDQAPEFDLDLVMDIPVDRTAGIYVGGKERLSCYVFRNDENKARIGFLPSANIGRALDYGFSDDEMEQALEQATSPEQNWAPLGDEPLIVRHYPGRSIRMK